MNGIIHIDYNILTTVYFYSELGDAFIQKQQQILIFFPELCKYCVKIVISPL